MVLQLVKKTVAQLVLWIMRWEKWLVAVFLALFFGSFGVLLFRFHRQSTVLVPASGGTYIEGSIGELLPWNPWFTVNNDVNRDIVSLVYAGLLRYNPQTKTIEEDLATLTISEDQKVYTLRLKDDLYWHDSTKTEPHPVTADDVLFTYQSVQDPAFPNSLLRQNFQGVTVSKIDERTIRFTLAEPYHFFTSNLTIGLLPRASFVGIPVTNFEHTVDFGFHPIGCGPYVFKSLSQTDLNSEVTLERFPRSLLPAYRLDRIILRIYPDYQSLLSDLPNLDGIRLVPHDREGEPVVPTHFRAKHYTLPQYVGLFFNLDRAMLSDKKLRVGLQLGTNKEEIAALVGNAVIVDTPLLEIDTSDWHYQYDSDAAQGALYESQWYLPEKIRLQELLEMKETNDVGALHVSPVVLLQTGASLRITGTYKDRADLFVNGLAVQKELTATGSWFLNLPGGVGTGALSLGTNLLRITTGDGTVIDSFYLWRTTDIEEFKRADTEQRLLEIFVASRRKGSTVDEKVTARDLTLDQGFLRRRLLTDAIGIRKNSAGKSLSLTLVTSPSPPEYRTIAENIRDEWAKLGVSVVVEVPATRQDFEERLLDRNYDVLLFGQSLLDNLDSYPYWHSEGKQSSSKNKAELKLDAYNLSQYSSFEADNLLETIRSSVSDAVRSDSLSKLREVLKRDVPAIFLYSPLYTFAQRNDVQGVDLGTLSLHSDRLLSLSKWYVNKERAFKPGKGWLSFFSWLFTQSNPPSGLTVNPQHSPTSGNLLELPARKNID